MLSLVAFDIRLALLKKRKKKKLFLVHIQAPPSKERKPSKPPPHLNQKAESVTAIQGTQLYVVHSHIRI